MPGGERPVMPPREEAAEPLPTSLNLPFRPQCWRSGAASFVGACGLTLTGGFLWWEIPSTPWIATQLAIVGFLLIAGGLVFAVRAVHDLHGRLVIDRESARVLPAPLGFRVAWRRLKCWEVQERPLANSLPTIRFWVVGDDRSRGVQHRCLSNDDRRRVESLLRAWLPEFER